MSLVSYCQTLDQFATLVPAGTTSFKAARDDGYLEKVAAVLGALTIVYAPAPADQVSLTDARIPLGAVQVTSLAVT